MQVHIKNMVCQRCITAVKAEFEKLGLLPLHVALGEVTLKENTITANQLKQLDESLVALGFERIDDKKSRLIASLKTLVIKAIHQVDEVNLKVNWSDFLSEHLHYDYNYISGLFSSVEGITIEQYIIKQKVERAKELLVYDELNLSEIAYKLGYSSVAHLSSQFKKNTGFTPSEFKKNHTSSRNPLDKL